MDKENPGAKQGGRPTRRDFLRAGSCAGIAGLGLPLRPAGPEAQAPAPSRSPGSQIVLENQDFRLRISRGGRAESLLHKATGQECLMPGVRVPMFVLTQDRPYNNELQLRFPAKRKSYPARSVEQKGDLLLVRFELVDHLLTIRTKATDSYIAFQIERLQQDLTGVLRPGAQTPADEIWFAQLPVKDRANFGEWLNVVWDDQVAVNLLAADPYARIDSEEREGHRLLQAGTMDDVRTEGVGAALIVCKTGQLLDRIDRLETDCGLPRGVQSRKRPEYSWSYYWVWSDLTPGTVDSHIQYASQSGFRTIMVYYQAFSPASGHFVWRPEFPNRLEDLKAVVAKIHGAGMLAGLHFHYNKTFGMDPYITPKPDSRLNIRQFFTLSAAVTSDATVIPVEENPRECRLVSAVAELKVGDEVVTYGGFTTEPPYQFTGCRRGEYGTSAAAYPAGAKIGLLGEVAGVTGVFDQRTSIQGEVAERLAGIYDGAGFDFAYFDGAEDVPPPYWFNVSWAQWLTYRAFKRKPLFSEGACKSHFSWHILTRGNAFDVFRPEVFKAAVKEHPGEEAPRIAQDFTGLNFGWTGYEVPSGSATGTQPDMLEYVSSRAAAWDCPISFRPRLSQLAAHPRTADNLEVLRRWEEVRFRKWLTPAQKLALRNLDQEHTLLVNEKGGFELVPYRHIQGAAGANPSLRAFLFERGGLVCVVIWHASGEGRLRLRLAARSVRLRRELRDPEIAISRTADEYTIPVGARACLEIAGLSPSQVIKALEGASLS